MSEFSARIYRGAFVAAAAYNFAFGLWAALTPRAFFDLFSLAPGRYPSIWACLGMVVGLYGAAYAYASRHLDRAFPFIAIGLAGKILGPIGWLLAVGSGELPFRTFPLIVFNDLIWWLPFSLFLLEGTRAADLIKRSAPDICAALHMIAAFGTVWLLRGMTFTGDSPVGWRLGWLIWMAAALSLIGFFAWWGSRLSSSRLALIALGIGSIGLICDFAGESLLIGWLPRAESRLSGVTTLLTAGAANGLYTVAGIMLTMATGMLPAPLRVWTWMVWISGLSLTFCAVADVPRGLMISSALLIVLFIPWVIFFSRRLR